MGMLSWFIWTGPWTAAYQAPPSMDFPGKSTGVGCHCLLQQCNHWVVTNEWAEARVSGRAKRRKRGDGSRGQSDVT